MLARKHIKCNRRICEGTLTSSAGPHMETDGSSMVFLARRPSWGCRTLQGHLPRHSQQLQTLQGRSWCLGCFDSLPNRSRFRFGNDWHIMVHRHPMGLIQNNMTTHVRDAFAQCEQHGVGAPNLGLSPSYNTQRRGRLKLIFGSKSFASPYSMM